MDGFEIMLQYGLKGNMKISHWVTIRRQERSEQC